MKGITFLNFLKPFLGLYLCACPVSAVENKNKNSTTTTTTTTAKPFDLAGVETRYFENSVPVLHPGESFSRSQSLSYSKSTENYENQNPGYGGDASEYGGHSEEQFYDDNKENNYQQHGQERQAQHPQSVDYSNSHEAVTQQHYHENDRKNYKKPSEQNKHYPYPEYTAKEQPPYVLQESYGVTKDGKYGDAPQLFRYAYEISSEPQHHESYDLSGVPKSVEKSSYGQSGSQDYSPKAQQADYYPKPKPTRYISENNHKESYKSDQKDNYFPDIPKEAGYVSNIQKEHEYLLNPQSEPSYSKQAGYSLREKESSGFIPMVPKEKSISSTNEGKVALFIKHLGHKAPGTNQYVSKEKQGFLLLPVLHHKIVDEKLKELGRKSSQEHNQDYEYNKQTNLRHSPEVKKQEYVQQKVIHYPVNVKVGTVQHVPSYSLHERPVNHHGKTTVSHSNYHIVGPAIKHTSNGNSEYKNAEAYAEDDKSDAPYVPQSVAVYGKQPAEKTYSTGTLSYDGHHREIPSLSDAIKYDQPSLYSKQPEYTHHYEGSTAHKPAPIKVKDSSFSSIYHAQGYPRIVDLSLIASKSKKSSPISSHIYSTGVGEAPKYRNQALKSSSDHGKSFLESLQKSEDFGIAGFKPSSYTSRGRVSARGLVDGFGLHDYESLLSKPSHGGSVDSLYYDLHSFPAEHIYTRFHYPRSRIPTKLVL